MRFLVQFLANLPRCAGCGRRILEYRRRPCRACGSINRIIGRTAEDGFTTADRA